MNTHSWYAETLESGQWTELPLKRFRLDVSRADGARLTLGDREIAGTWRIYLNDSLFAESRVAA